MKIANRARSGTDSFTLFTSMVDGHMYLRVENDTSRYDIKLTEENRDALKVVLGPTENWSGLYGMRS